MYNIIDNYIINLVKSVPEMRYNSFTVRTTTFYMYELNILYRYTCIYIYISTLKHEIRREER